MQGIPERISKEVKEWFKGKTIKRIKVIRPIKKEKEMYEEKLRPMSLKFIFTDGTGITLDSWVGAFKPKPIWNGTQHLRLRSYLTVSRKEKV